MLVIRSPRFIVYRQPEKYIQNTVGLVEYDMREVGTHVVPMSCTHAKSYLRQDVPKNQGPSDSAFEVGLQSRTRQRSYP